MVALSRYIAPAAALFASVQCARITKRRSEVSSDFQSHNTKFIAGVPIVNYHAAHGGEGGLVGIEENREADWIVMMKPGSTDAQIDSLCKSTRSGCRGTGHPDKGGVPFFGIHGTERELEEVIKKADGAVQVVEPDQVLHMIPEVEVEPAASSASWGLDRVGARGRGGNLGAGVSIYILDTGVRYSHQDFGGRAFPEVDYSWPIPSPCEGDMQCAIDNQGHGTHCAGTAAGTTFGVAPMATVHGMKVLGDSGAGNLISIIGSVDYLSSTGRRPAVGSMSLGGTCPLGFCGMYFLMNIAVNRAVESGVTVVVAGGNSNADSCGFMPAYVPAAITVGATDSLDQRSHFSNYGSCTNIWAPGSRITSATHEDDTGAKTFSGTSMACPHVAGGVALVLEQFPEFKAEQVLEKMHAKAATNYVKDLQPGDVNKMLYIAKDAPPPLGDEPPPPETPCPSYCLVCWSSACEGCCD